MTETMKQCDTCKVTIHANNDWWNLVTKNEDKSWTLKTDLYLCNKCYDKWCINQNIQPIGKA